MSLTEPRTNGDGHEAGCKVFWQNIRSKNVSELLNDFEPVPHLLRERCGSAVKVPLEDARGAPKKKKVQAPSRGQLNWRDGAFAHPQTGTEPLFFSRACRIANGAHTIRVPC